MPVDRRSTRAQRGRGTPLDVVVLGTGKAGRAQLAWFREDPRVRIVGVWNRTRSTAEAVAAEFGCPALDRWEDALARPGLDLVSLCGPSSTRAVQALPFLAAGIPVLSEKPMARTLGDCDAMVDAAAATGTPLFCVFNMRFHPVVEAVSKALPRIGQIVAADIAYTQHRTSVTWRHQLEQGGGVLKEQAVHVFDLLLGWVGPVVEVAANTLVVHPGREVEDQGDVLLRFASRATAHVHASYNDPRPEVMTAALVGTEGRIDFVLSPYDPAANVVTVSSGSEERRAPLRPPETIDPVYPGLLDATKRLIRFVVDRVIDGGDPWIDGRAGRASIEVAAAAYVSDQRGLKVPLPLTLPEAPSSGWRPRHLGDPAS